MASLNKVMIIGNAGRDAELRYLASGTAMAQFSVAVNSRRRGQSGDWEESTEWFNVVVWGEQAERVSQYITKGKQIYVEGRLQTRSWDNDQGVKQYRTEVIANTIQLLGGRAEGGGGGDGWGDGGESRAPSYGGGRQGGQGGGQSSGQGGQRGGGWSNREPVDADDLPFE